MFLIALAGGVATERAAIAAQLTESRIQAFDLATPSTDFAHRRVELLRQVLDAPHAAPHVADGLVITHCLTEEEAQEVRQRGGVVWHLYSRPSASVLIRLGDRMVAIERAEPPHVLEPLEALSELMIARLASPAGKGAQAFIAGLAGRE